MVFNITEDEIRQRAHEKLTGTGRFGRRTRQNGSGRVAQPSKPESPERGSKAASSSPSQPKSRIIRAGRKPPNKTEQQYADHYLAPAKAIGGIADYRPHAITLLLADGLRYTPDWCVWRKVAGTQELALEFHEVKGAHVRDDAIAKFKVAVSGFRMHRFTLAQKMFQNEWRIQTFNDHRD